MTAKQQVILMLIRFIKSEDFIKPMSRFCVSRASLSTKTIYENINAVKEVCDMLADAYNKEVA